MSNAPSSNTRPAATGGFDWVLLPRHGLRPLRFAGRLLLRIESEQAARSGRLPHWSQICVYECSHGGIAAGVSHIPTIMTPPDITLPPRPMPWRNAWEFVGPPAMIAYMTAHDPAAVWPIDLPTMAARREAWAELVLAGFGHTP